ncbi:MAG: class I SAM-dependent methyltransferase [Promethearchaeota archaeon]
MKCYLCGKQQLNVIRYRVRHDISRKVIECQNCGLNYLFPKKENLKEFYRKNYREKYTPKINGIVDCRTMFNIYLPFQQYRLNELKDILNSDMKILDVGCSTGHLLYTLKDYVQECVGIEYNIQDAAFTEKELGFKTYTTSIKETDLPLEYFDLITICQVLEHLQDPIEFVKIYRDYLKDDGYIFVEVPNVRDILLSGYNVQSYHDFWYREPHLFNFSPKTLKICLEKAGFKGEIKGAQRYNFLNHLNWIFLKKPQKNAEIGMSKPVLITNSSINENIKKEINDWFVKVDEDYKNLLVKLKLSDSIIFIGKKS